MATPFLAGKISGSKSLKAYTSQRRTTVLQKAEEAAFLLLTRTYPYMTLCFAPLTFRDMRAHSLIRLASGGLYLQEYGRTHRSILCVLSPLVLSQASLAVSIPSVGGFRLGCLGGVTPVLPAKNGGKSSPFPRKGNGDGDGKRGHINMGALGSFTFLFDCLLAAFLA